MNSFISFTVFSFSNITALDLILGICFLIGMVNGFQKGFIRSLTSLIAVVVGAYIAVFFSDTAVEFLNRFLDINPDLLGIGSLIFIFFLVFASILILGRLLSNILDFVALGLVNKLAGGFFGLLKWLFIASLALNLLITFEDEDKKIMPIEVTEDSYLFKPVTNFGKKIWPILIENIRESPV